MSEKRVEFHSVSIKKPNLFRVIQTRKIILGDTATKNERLWNRVKNLLAELPSFGDSLPGT